MNPLSCLLGEILQMIFSNNGGAESIVPSPKLQGKRKVDLMTISKATDLAACRDQLWHLPELMD